MKKPERLADIIGKSLSGYKVVHAYMLFVDLGSATCMTVLTSKELTKKSIAGKPVICLNRKLMGMIEKNIYYNGRTKVVTITLLANRKEKLGFVLFSRNVEGNELQPRHIFLEDELKKICKENQPFYWSSPGEKY